MADETPSRTPSRWPGWLMALLTFLLVVGVAAAGWWQLRGTSPFASESDDVVPPTARSTAKRGTPSGSPTRRTLVRSGADYYAHVKLVELASSPQDDDAWDTGGGAPDINYKLFWNGTLVFESAQRDDTLIAEWDLLRLDLKDAILRGEVEVAAAVNAPLVHAGDGGVLTIEVWDDDVMSSDQAGRFDLPLATLEEDVNELTFDAGGVRRLVLDLVPRDMDLPDLLERASAR